MNADPSLMRWNASDSEQEVVDCLERISVDCYLAFRQTRQDVGGDTPKERSNAN